MRPILSVFPLEAAAPSSARGLALAGLAWSTRSGSTFHQSPARLGALRAHRKYDPVSDPLRIVMSGERTERPLRVAAVALADGYRRQGLGPD